MKFNDYKYERPVLEKIQADTKEYLDLIATGKSASIEIEAINKYYSYMDSIETNITLCQIRNSIDTTNEFYEKEMEVLNEVIPHLEAIGSEFTKKVLESSNKAELEKEFGSLFFKKLELDVKTFDPKIIDKLIQENKLSTEYSKLMGTAQIKFEGKTYTISQMAPFNQSKDREIRKSASLTVSKWFKKNQNEFDRIYDELVKVRHEIAIDLGYENYIQLGYDKMGRTDYNANHVKKYRKQILDDVVPLVTKLMEVQAKRIKVSNPQSFDFNLKFLNGNPTPKGDVSWQVAKAKNMYEQMSKETGKFFNFMLTNDLLDLDSKPGKQPGGYCTYLPNYKAPFIFANFNGTAHDVNVLTHEAGHAFQVYSSKELFNPYRWPTYEACEIHSMSMEFLAWPWMNEFFLEDTEKFKYDHLEGSISFLPYGALIDHFQHEVYKKPQMTPRQRRSTFRKLEKKYLPYIKYEEDKFLDTGGWFFKQSHVFGAPFYYIDYTLAQVCAFQYWARSRENYSEALKSYTKLCKQGGSRSFLGLVKYAKLKNPFKKGSIKEIIQPIEEYLDSVEDSRL